MRKLVQSLKENSEDFEFYPTTNKILERVIRSASFKKASSVLDIGCGNGKALDYFQKSNNKLKLFGIEKSQTLIQNLVNPNILILGNDFRECMLLDKKVDLIFCNPPYKEFKEWVIKILRYSVANSVIFVVPKRWENDIEIQQEIKSNWIKSSLGFFDFLESEDRKARAQVEVICFDRIYIADSVFIRELENSFGLGKLISDLEKKDCFRELGQSIEKDSQSKQIVGAKDMILYLLNRFEAEQKETFDSLMALAKVDYSILQRLSIRKTNLLEAIEYELFGLKRKYWREAIDRISEISKRLTHEQKEDLFQTLSDRGAEFTKSNILGVILFAINVAKKCEQSNIVAYWELLANRDFLIQYKSNIKAFGDSHRYEKPENYHRGKLDYRIVVPNAGKFWFDKYLRECKAINNLQVIANSLGFDGELKILSKNNDLQDRDLAMIVLPVGENFVYIGDKKIARVKVFLNSNIHIFFDQDFLAKLNLSVFSHLGWIKNKQDAKRDFKELSDAQIESFFEAKNETLLLENLI